MPYRDPVELGARLSEHRVRGGKAAQYLAAGVLGIAFAILLGWWALSARKGVDLRLLVGTGAMLWLAWTFFGEWRRMGGLVLELHERGLRFTEAGVVREVFWADVIHAELRYVPGMRKRGLDDEGNRVSLRVGATRGGEVCLPHEIVGFDQVIAAVRERTQVPVQRLLIANLTQR